MLVVVRMSNAGESEQSSVSLDSSLFITKVKGGDMTSFCQFSMSPIIIQPSSNMKIIDCSNCSQTKWSKQRFASIKN